VYFLLFFFVLNTTVIILKGRCFGVFSVGSPSLTLCLFALKQQPLQQPRGRGGPHDADAGHGGRAATASPQRGRRQGEPQRGQVPEGAAPLAQRLAAAQAAAQPHAPVPQADTSP